MVEIVSHCLSECLPFQGHRYVLATVTCSFEYGKTENDKCGEKKIKSCDKAANMKLESRVSIQLKQSVGCVSRSTTITLSFFNKN